MTRTTLLTRLAEAVVAAAGLASACSFYTDCPCAHQPAPSAKGGAGGRPATTGGLGGTGGLDVGGGAGGAGGEPANFVPVWSNVTGSLGGRNIACGGITMLSAKPDEDLLIAGLSEAGLVATRDGGKTWKSFGDGAQSQPISNRPSVIVYDPDNSARFWEAGTYVTPGVYRTDDDGATFHALADAWHNEFLSVDFSDSKRRTLLAGGHEQQQTLWRSSNGGDSWDQIGPHVPSNCSTTFPLVIDKNTFLLGCLGGILRSTDAGESWESVAALGGATRPLVTTDGSIYWGDQTGGLELSTDAGVTWTRTVGGGVLRTAPIELPDGRLAAVGTQTVMVSKDGGTRWDAVSAPLPFAPAGLVYSVQQRAFFIWESLCDPMVASDAIQRSSFDYEEQ